MYGAPEPGTFVFWPQLVPGHQRYIHAPIHRPNIYNIQAQLCDVGFPPGRTELALLRQAIVLGLRCTSTSMRNKWTGLLPKLLRRILMSVHAALNRHRSAVARNARGRHVEADVQVSEDLQGQSQRMQAGHGMRLVGVTALAHDVAALVCWTQVCRWSCVAAVLCPVRCAVLC